VVITEGAEVVFSAVSGRDDEARLPAVFAMLSLLDLDALDSVTGDAASAAEWADTRTRLASGPTPDSPQDQPPGAAASTRRRGVRSPRVVPLA
jgi:hypothetical protein